MTEGLFPAKTMRQILILIGIFLVLDLLVLTIVESPTISETFQDGSESTNSRILQNGSETTSNEFTEIILFYLPVVIGFPFLGFLIGFIVSLIPYKGIAYSKKYLPFSLITILILYIIVFIRILIRIIT